MQKNTLLICLILVFIAVICWYAGTHVFTTTATSDSGLGLSMAISPTPSISPPSPLTTPIPAFSPVSAPVVQTKTPHPAASTASDTALYTITCLEREILCGVPDNAVCINPSTDPSNCGGCGLMCGNDQSCTDGSCIFPTTPPLV